MDVPKTTGKDIVYTSFKATLESIPGAGAAAGAILGLLLTSPIEKRRDEWMQDVGERLQRLEAEKKLDLSTLSANNQFIDTVLQATTLALKTSQLEKITAFKNIITNTAKGYAPDETKSQIFLSLVDSFSVWHLKILYLFDDPRRWYQANNRNPPSFESYVTGSLTMVINHAFPDLRQEPELINIIWEDLSRAGLHNTPPLRDHALKDQFMSPRTTKLGKQFISFISSHD